MKLKYKKIIPVLTLGFLFLFNATVFAASTAGDRGLVGCGTSTGTECTSISQLVVVVIRIIDYLFSFASMVALVFIVWAGYQMVTAGGNEEKIATAKTSLSDAVIGFFLIMISFVLLNAIVLILGKYSLKDLYNFLPHP